MICRTTLVLYSQLLHFRCFGAHYKTCNFICFCDQLPLEGKLFQMFISCISFRNVLSETCWSLPSFNDCSNSYGDCNRFSSTECDTCGWFFCVSNFFQPQFRCRTSWPAGEHHSLQTRWATRMDTRTNRAASLTVWSLTCPNLMAPFCHCAHYF